MSVATLSAHCLICAEPLPRSAAVRCPNCATEIVEVNGRRLAAVVETRAVSEPGFSRWRGGATNVGWAGRIAATLLLVGVVWWMSVAAATILQHAGDSALAVWFSGVAIPFVALSVARIWRPTRVRR